MQRADRMSDYCHCHTSPLLVQYRCAHSYARYCGTDWRIYLVSHNTQQRLISKGEYLESVSITSTTSAFLSSLASPHFRATVCCSNWSPPFNWCRKRWRCHSCRSSTRIVDVPVPLLRPVPTFQGVRKKKCYFLKCSTSTKWSISLSRCGD